MTTIPNRHDHQTLHTQKRWSGLAEAPATAISTIWLTVVVSALVAPDMITGSNHEHLPLAGLTIWIWASAASGFVALGAQRVERRAPLVVGSSFTWLLVLLAVVATPSLVTGTDPTTIPLAALIAPVVGAFATGFIALSGCPRRD